MTSETPAHTPGIEIASPADDSTFNETSFAPATFTTALSGSSRLVRACGPLMDRCHGGSWARAVTWPPDDTATRSQP